MQIDPQNYLMDVISQIANGHPNSQIADFLPRAYPAAPMLKVVA